MNTYKHISVFCFSVFLCDSGDFHGVVHVFSLSVFRTGGHPCIHIKPPVQTPSRVAGEDYSHSSKQHELTSQSFRPTDKVSWIYKK